MQREDVSYLRVELIDLLNGGLDIPRMNRSTDLDSFLNRLDICAGLDIGLEREFLRRSRVAIGDEVVHNQIIDITFNTSMLANDHN